MVAENERILSLSDTAVRTRRWRRTPDGQRRIEQQNRHRRHDPLYAWYYRWYNRGHWRTFPPVPAPRIVAGRIVLDGPAERYLPPAERALYESGAYLLILPERRQQAPRPLGRRLTPGEVERIKAAIDTPGVLPRDGTQTRLACTFGVSLSAINLIAHGKRHPDTLHRSRLLDDERSTTAAGGVR